MRDFDKVLKACADKNRIRILKALEKKRLCVCELAFILGISQPSVSRHLKKLKGAGFIESRQDSFWTNYFIKPENRYAKAISSCMKRWLNEDGIIRKDIARLNRVNREKLCQAKQL